jgi:hypothetical protein
LVNGSPRIEVQRWRTQTVFDLEDHYLWLLRGAQFHQPVFGPIGFSVIGEVAQGVWHTWAQPLHLDVMRSPGGRFTVCGRFSAGRPAPQQITPDGVYIVKISSRNYQAEPIADVTFDRRKPTIHVRQLRPGYAYPFPHFRNAPPTLLYGQVCRADRRGLAGVILTIHGHAALFRYRTDATGRWVLPLDALFTAGQPSATLQLDVAAPGLAVQHLTVTVQKGERRVEPPLLLPV